MLGIHQVPISRLSCDGSVQAGATGAPKGLFAEVYQGWLSSVRWMYSATRASVKGMRQEPRKSPTSAVRPSCSVG